MNTQNARPEFADHRTAPTEVKDVNFPRDRKRTLSGQVELSLDENFDHGSDPYNSTGQHVIFEKHEI